AGTANTVRFPAKIAIGIKDGMDVNRAVMEIAFFQHLRPRGVQYGGEWVVLHPERAGELIHVRPRPFQRRSGGDLAAIKIYVNNERARIAQSNDFFQQERKNFFRALRLKQTKNGRTSRLGCTPSIHTSRL